MPRFRIKYRPTGEDYGVHAAHTAAEAMAKVAAAHAPIESREVMMASLEATEIPEPTPQVPVASCQLVEGIILRAHEFFGDKPIDSLILTAYINAAAILTQAQIVSGVQREIAAMSLQQAFGNMEDPNDN